MNNNHIKLIQEEIGGGKITLEQIKELSKVDAIELTISGLDQNTFKFFVENYAHKFEIINFFKCPSVYDLSSLEKLENIRKISWFWNKKVTQLWDISKNEKLKDLELRDFLKLKDLSFLSHAISLEKLRITGGIWNTREIHSLTPLIKIKTLKEVELFNLNILNDGLSPLAHMKALKKLDFSANMFTTEQIAWLSAKIENRINSDNLQGYSYTDDNCIIMGKRKPILDINTDKDRIDRYIKKFETLVQYYHEYKDEKEPS